MNQKNEVFKNVQKKFLEFLLDKSFYKGYAHKRECRKFLSGFKMSKKESNKFFLTLHRLGIIRLQNEKIFLCISPLTLFFLQEILDPTSLSKVLTRDIRIE